MIASRINSVANLSSSADGSQVVKFAVIVAIDGVN